MFCFQSPTSARDLPDGFTKDLEQDAPAEPIHDQTAADCRLDIVGDEQPSGTHPPDQLAQPIHLLAQHPGGMDSEQLQGHTSGMTSMVWSPDGRRIASGSYDKTIGFWDAATGKPVGEFLQGHTDGVLSLSWSRDGRRIVSGSDDRNLQLWDATTGKPIGPPLEGHEGPVNSVVFSSDGSRVISGSADNTIRFWDAVASKLILTFF